VPSQQQNVVYNRLQLFGTIESLRIDSTLVFLVINRIYGHRK